MDAKIQASLIPNKEANDYINLTDEGVHEIRKKGFELYRTPQLMAEMRQQLSFPIRLNSLGRTLTQNRSTDLFKRFLQDPILPTISTVSVSCS